MNFEKKSVEAIKAELLEKLQTGFGSDLEEATDEQIYQALGMMVRDEVLARRSASRGIRKQTGQLDQTGYLFEISIEHRKKIVLPNYSESGVFLGTYTTYYETYHIEDILDAVYDTGEYRLSFGDFVTVTVRSREAKRSAGIVSMLLGTGSSLADHITYTDGGLIWNEAY